MTSEIDEEAVRRLASGDREAFRVILDRHEERVFHFALALARSTDTAADITQDTFLVLLRNPDAYDPARGALSSFLLGIARNLVLKEFRRRKRESGLADADDLPAREAVAGEKVEKEERLIELRAAVVELSSVQRQVVTLRFQQELALREIAEVMLLPLNTLKSHMRRAVMNLRKAIGGGDHEV